MERRMQFNLASVIIVSFYVIVGIVHNYARVYLAPANQTIASLIDPIAIAVWIIMYGFIFYSVAGWNWPLSEWGFTLDKRVWISLGLIVLFSIIKISELRQKSAPLMSFDDPSLLVNVVGAVMEELIFRVFLIFSIIKLLGNGKGQIAVAVFVCAFIFAIGHIPGRGANEVVGIFLTWFLMGYIVVGTKSLLFPAFVHVVMNTIDGFGLFGGVIFIAAYMSLAGIDLKLNRTFARQET